MGRVWVLVRVEGHYFAMRYFWILASSTTPRRYRMVYVWFHKPRHILAIAYTYVHVQQVNAFPCKRQEHMHTYLCMFIFLQALYLQSTITFTYTLTNSSHKVWVWIKSLISQTDVAGAEYVANIAGKAAWWQASVVGIAWWEPHAAAHEPFGAAM